MSRGEAPHVLGPFCAEMNVMRKETAKSKERVSIAMRGSKSRMRWGVGIHDER